MSGVTEEAKPEPKVMSAGNEPARVVLLGPQSARPTLREVVEDLELNDGAIATITAGWQERESEDKELDEHLDGRSVNLMLHSRAEKIFSRDSEFREAHRRTQRSLRELRRLYNIRLSSAMDTVLSLLRESSDPALLDPEIQAALLTLRSVDTWHMHRIDEIRDEFRERWKPWERVDIVREREQVAGLLGSMRVLAIAGGHVAVVLNRLRLFGIQEQLKEKTIIAWSAGAMALSETVVLFHDSPPQGPGHAEVFEQGLSVFPGVIPLPHGHRRLRLDDGARVARFARRFLDTTCVILEAGSRLDWDGVHWASKDGVETLSSDGQVRKLNRW